MVLEILDNGISDSGILRCVANEDGGRTTARPLVAVAFGHFWCPRPLRGIVAHAFRVGNLGTLGSRNVRFRAVNSRGRRTPFGRRTPDGLFTLCRQSPASASRRPNQLLCLARFLDLL